MDDLPINRASNPFKNQGYMLRLARQRGGGMLGRRSSGCRRQRKRQRGGALNAYMAMKSGQKIGRKLDGWFKRNKKLAGWIKKQRGGGVGKFLAAKAPIFATLGTGYRIGKFLGKNHLKLLGMEMKKSISIGRKEKKFSHTSQRSIKSFLVSVSSSVLKR